MQRHPRNFVSLFPLLLLCCFAPHLHAQMKLLSPGTGWWIVTGPRLLWTNDNGAHWKDITPRLPFIPKLATTLRIVFFRDTSEGWAIVSHQEPIDNGTPEAHREQRTIYSIVHTKNSGQSWDALPLNYPPLPKWEQDWLDGPASLYFLDSLHGWLDIGFQSMFHPGKLLATDDGGQTWNWVGSPIHSGPVFFNSLEDGWLISNWGADQLYVTHDGAKTWTEVGLKLPTGVGSRVRPIFLEMPQFQNDRNGYLAVEYAGPEGTPSKLVVYQTQSGGMSWQPLKTFPMPLNASFALTDSIVVLPTGTAPGEVSTESVSIPNQEQPPRPVSSLRAHTITALSFVDANNGWAIINGCGLYATENGGFTWRNISPPPSMPLHKQFTFRNGRLVTSSSPSASR